MALCSWCCRVHCDHCQLLLAWSRYGFLCWLFVYSLVLSFWAISCLSGLRSGLVTPLPLSLCTTAVHYLVCLVFSAACALRSVHCMRVLASVVFVPPVLVWEYDLLLDCSVWCLLIFILVMIACPLYFLVASAFSYQFLPVLSDYLVPWVRFTLCFMLITA